MERTLGRPISAWPLATWDETNLVLAAIYFNPQLKASEASLRVATAAKQTAGERPNPTVGVAPAYNTTTTIPSPWIITPTFDFPLETAGKRRYRVEQAAHLAEAACWDHTACVWNVRSRLRKALLDVQTTRQATALSKAQQDLHATNLRCAESQHAEGAISAFELSLVRSASDTAKLALVEAQRQERAATLALAEAIGLPADALVGKQLAASSLVPPLDLSSAPAQPEVRQSALHFRADLRSSLARYAATESALQLELARQYPDIHLNPGYEFDQGDHKWALGLTVTIPLLSRNRGPIAEAEAKRSEAEAAFLVLQARVIADVDTALADYLSSLESVSTAHAVGKALEAQEKAAASRFQAGEISAADWAAVRLEANSSRITLMNTLAKAGEAQLALESARQEPDPTWAGILRSAARELKKPAGASGGKAR